MKRIQQLLFFLTATLVTLTSCHKDSTEEYFAPRSVTVEIAVRPDAMIGLTRSTDEMAIRDVNLYLYAKKGAMVLHRYFVSRQFSFECPPGDYMLYLIANAREDLGELDETQLEDYAIHWQGSYEELPMTTCQELSITTGPGTTQSLSIEVTRQVAKVACNIAVASAVRDIHLESVQFCNLPQQAHPFSDGSPSDRAENYAKGPLTELSEAEAATCTLTGYMLENRQGEVPSISDQREKNPDHAPRYATFLMIRATRNGKVLAYRVYLGENNTTNFDVRPNTFHTLHITILGDNEVDTRVNSYTVSVHDDIEEEGFGGYCCQDSQRELIVTVDGANNDLLLECEVAVEEGDADALYVDRELVGDSQTLQLYRPNGSNNYGIDYAPQVYDASNNRLTYTVTVRDEYDFQQIFRFTHRYANMLGVYTSTTTMPDGNGKGLVTVDGELYSQPFTGASENLLVLCGGDGCMLRATAVAGYKFAGWYSDPAFTKRLSSAAEYHYVPTTHRGSIFARFQIDGHTPLDGNGTANCYIARALNTGYSFNARVKGNGKSTTGITASALNGTTARVIWESGTGFGSVVRYAIYDHGRIYFSTGTTHGNAVIGLFDDRDRCIWSWHIWAVDYEPFHTAQTYSTGAVFMDRNLGAESTATSDVVSKGLYFQRGRKDPFIYPKENRKTDNRMPATTWNLQGYEFEVHSHYTGNYPLSDYSIAWSLEHPTSFIGSAPNPAGSNPVYFSTWLVDYNPYLWGYPSGEKSIYDPCPPGWKVPSSSAWDKTVFKKASGITSWGWYMYYNGTATSFYPFNGYLEDSSGTLQYYVPTSWTRMWTSDPSSSGAQTAKSVDVLDSGIVQIATGNFQTHGHGIRCVKE